MPRHSSRFTYLAPEQQITQYLVDNPLVNAILDDEEDKIIQIVKEGDCDLNKPDADRQTALHYAAFIGNPVILFRNLTEVLVDILGRLYGPDTTWISNRSERSRWVHSSSSRLCRRPQRRCR